VAEGKIQAPVPLADVPGLAAEQDLIMVDARRGLADLFPDTADDQVTHSCPEARTNGAS
jgi:hypothetical protein